MGLPHAMSPSRSPARHEPITIVCRHRYGEQLEQLTRTRTPMPTNTHGIDPATVAGDACYAAGLSFRGIDIDTFDPLRAALAERFAEAARDCHGDPVALTAVIRPLLAEAVRACRLQIEAEALELRG